MKLAPVFAVVDELTDLEAQPGEAIYTGGNCLKSRHAWFCRPWEGVVNFAVTGKNFMQRNTPTRLHDAREFAKEPVLLGDLLGHVLHDDDVERAVIEGK